MTAAQKSSDVGFLVLLALAAAAMLATVHFVFYVVPTEATMGVVQKIFYFHVPAIVVGMYGGAVCCFIGSAGYLARGTRGFDAFARAGAEVAVVMGLLMMVSGPLWAKKAWGVYWTWDPRLTTSLLSVLIYVAYVILRAFTGGGEAERKFAAALGVLGAANLPIIHYSVKKWGGTHPEVINKEGGGLKHPDMVTGLMMGFVAFLLLTLVLVWLRTRMDLAAAKLEAADEEALELGIGED